MINYRPISLSLNALNDLRQVEALLIEIVRGSVLKSGSETDSIFYHIRSAKGHIIDAIDEIEECTDNCLEPIIIYHIVKYWSLRGD